MEPNFFYLEILANWPLLVVTSYLTLLTVILYRRYFSPISDVPGPFFASFTRLWHISQVIKGRQGHRFLELHQKYGPFVRIAPNEISVSHPDAPKQLLLSHIDKAPWYKTNAIPDYRFQTPLSTTDAKLKAQRSKNFAPGYSLTNLLKSEEPINNVIYKFLDWMDKYSSDQEPMDLDLFFTYAAADIVGEVTFSKSFGFITLGRDIDNTLAMGRPANMMAAIIGYFRWISLLMTNPLVTWSGIMPFGHMFHTAMAAVAEREQNLDSRFDILAHWLRIMREHPDRMTLRDLQGQVATSTGAGADTVSAGLQTFVYHMIRHSACWKRAQDEIAEAQSQGRCQDRVISYSNAQQLPYFQACIKESLRIFATNHMGLPRVAPKDGLTIGSRTFPEGTVLSIHPFSMHFNTDCWGRDAHEFKPTRWLAEDIALREKYWLPFGLGYTQCPGINLAKIELSKILATVVRDYDIRQVNPEQEWKYEAYFGTLQREWPVYVKRKVV